MDGLWKGRGMTEPLRFALNRTCLPHKPLGEFLALAKHVGAGAVELRSDLPGFETLTEPDPARLRAVVEDAGLSIASLNALADFNVVTSAKLEEAKALFDYAAALGAPAVVLCPTFDKAHHWSEAEAAANLDKALEACQPLLDRAGMLGLVEPLGMPHSTLFRQIDALEAIDKLPGGWNTFALLHDTFQYWRASDTQFFPEHIALVHISGISRTDKSRRELREPDREFVFVGDRAENVAQVSRMLSAGYRGWISMEPFNPSVQKDPEIASRLHASFDFVQATCRVPA